MERDLLVERTNAGLARACAEGKTLGRPKVTNKKSAAEISDKLRNGISVAQIAREHSVSPMTIMRIRDSA
jgi:putative DNA-invertase from lambdoid prophage Rac